MAGENPALVFDLLRNAVETLFKTQWGAFPANRKIRYPNQPFVIPKDSSGNPLPWVWCVVQMPTETPYLGLVAPTERCFRGNGAILITAVSPIRAGTSEIFLLLGKAKKIFLQQRRLQVGAVVGNYLDFSVGSIPQSPAETDESYSLGLTIQYEAQFRLDVS